MLPLSGLRLSDFPMQVLMCLSTHHLFLPVVQVLHNFGSPQQRGQELGVPDEHLVDST